MSDPIPVITLIKSAKPKSVIPLQKVAKLWNDDGSITNKGRSILMNYTRQWVDSRRRDLDAERNYPDFRGVFWEVRNTRFGLYLMGRAGLESRPPTPSELVAWRSITAR